MSSQGEPNVQVLLDTWRERGADRLDPVRFHFIEALARRAVGHNGDARRFLDDKLSAQLAAYEADVERAESKASTADGAQTVESVRGPLAGLIAYIASQAPADKESFASGDVASGRAAYPELPLMDYFRETWSKVNTDRQLRQSREHVPDNAGPLNSSQLVHRSLSLMRGLSPGYLRHFLSYVDALSWLEQMNGAGVASPKKGARGKPR